MDNLRSHFQFIASPSAAEDSPDSSSSKVKFMYSEKATKFCEIFPLLLTTVHTVKSKGKILQNFVAFSEYMNFKTKYRVVELREKNLISRS